MISLACLVRAHKRADTLRIVLDELNRYRSFPGLQINIVIMTDRPTDEVSRVCHDTNAYTLHAPRPILDASGEHFLEAQNAHLQYMEAWCDPDWVLVCDDDRWFEPRKITDALVPALSNDDVDAYYCPTVYIQDEPNLWNPDRHHEAILLYRHIPRARFTLKRMLNVPDAVHDSYVISNRVARFPVPVLEYGGASAFDRTSNIAAYKAAGKDDDFTRALLSPRRLKFPDDWDQSYGEWTDLSSPGWFQAKPVGYLPQDPG